MAHLPKWSAMKHEVESRRKAMERMFAIDVRRVLWRIRDTHEALQWLKELPPDWPADRDLVAQIIDACDELAKRAATLKERFGRT
jgi:hypothetical protein